MFKKTLFVLMASAMAAAPASAAVNLLVNGSFEQSNAIDGHFAGWTVVNNEIPNVQGSSAPVVITINNTNGYPTGAFGEAIPQDSGTSNPGLDTAGTHVAYFSSDTASSPNHIQSLSQTVSLEAGKSYTFGFDIYKPFNGDSNKNGATFSASLNGTDFASFLATDLPVGVWTHYYGANSFTADATGSFTFDFSSNGFPAKDFAIDRVYLAATDTIPAVPEPATWGLMLVGFGLMGAAIRRRNVRTSVQFA